MSDEFSFDEETSTVTVGKIEFIMNNVIEVYRDGAEIVFQYMNAEIRELCGDCDDGVLEKIHAHRLHVEIIDDCVAQVYGINRMLTQIPISQIEGYVVHPVGVQIWIKNNIFITMYGLNSPELPKISGSIERVMECEDIIVLSDDE